MMNLKLFVIEERLSTFWTPALLPLGELLFGERQVFGFRRLSFLPVVLYWLFGTSVPPPGAHGSE
jgi:hypothetical protein